MLQANSIFASISGEIGFHPQGSIVTFIRLQGCNLCCPYCDTMHALNENAGHNMRINEIISWVKTRRVLITGGEPLMQSDTNGLIKQLYYSDHIVQVETNGTLLPLNPLAYYVVDQKMFLPKHERALDDYMLRPTDWIKYVVCDQEELTTAIKEIHSERYNVVRPKRAISVVLGPTGFPAVPYNLVMDKLKEYGLQDEVIMNFQIHKLANLA